jgi:hypothetical protein
MGNTIVLFQDKYYRYGVNDNSNRRGLTIGEFESAFLADLEAMHIVGTLPAGYLCNVPLPRVPQIYSAQSHQDHKIPEYYKDPYAVPTYSSPCSRVERATFAFSPAWHAIAINNTNNLLCMFLMAVGMPI